MNRLQKPHSFWSFMLLALGLHGLVLCLPIDVNKPTEKPQRVLVKTVPLLKQHALAASPKPSPSYPAAVTPKPLPQRSAAKRTPAVAQRSTASLEPKPTPVSPAKPTPAPSPDVFQIQGTIACDGIKNCYASAETNGRLVSETLEQQLRDQGYTLQPIELDEDTGMKVYHLFQNGQPKDYLHIIWTDQGTRHLRLPQPVTNRQELAAVARLAPQAL